MSEDNGTKTSTGNDMGDLMQAIGGPIQKAATKMAMKAATQYLSNLWNNFKRFLATASDPFFRRDMGERYFGNENLFGGLVVWIVGTAASSVFYFFFGLFSQSGPLIMMACWSTGAALVGVHFAFGTESLSKMAKYRADGIAYHSRSRGVPRFPSPQITLMVVIGMALLLLIFNFVSFLFFIVSCVMSAKLAAEQDAAIYARYLDALDAKIEQEYLEQAILGRCPVEITQLSRPLPTTMKPDLRENIAAAAVGKPVTIVTQPAGRTGAKPPIVAAPTAP